MHRDIAWHRDLTLAGHLPGDPAINVNGCTTVSGGRTVLSAITQQSFRIDLLPYRNQNFKLIKVESRE